MWLRPKSFNSEKLQLWWGPLSSLLWRIETCGWTKVTLFESGTHMHPLVWLMAVLVKTASSIFNESSWAAACHATTEWKIKMVAGTSCVRASLTWIFHRAKQICAHVCPCALWKWKGLAFYKEYIYIYHYTVGFLYMSNFHESPGIAIMAAINFKIAQARAGRPRALQHPSEISPQLLDRSKMKQLCTWSMHTSSMNNPTFVWFYRPLLFLRSKWRTLSGDIPW